MPQAVQTQIHEGHVECIDIPATQRPVSSALGTATGAVGGPALQRGYAGPV